jgi:hypothetical protein
VEVAVRYIASALVLLISHLALASPLSAQTAVEVGYLDFSYGSGVGRPTGEKPESKLWWNDGQWWGSLFNQDAQVYRIHRLDLASQTWVDTGTTLDNRRRSRADILWDESTSQLYVSSHYYSSSNGPASASQRGRLYRYTYHAGSKTYTLDPGFPVIITEGNSEAMTIAKDSVGRLWVTYVEAGQLKINRSLSHDGEWATPVTLTIDGIARHTDPDDISAVIAFGGDKIGVMWSDQLTRTLSFAYRSDWDAPEVWQSVETVLPGAGCSERCADDHINLKTDSTGRVFAAVKTSARRADEPLVMLVVREVSGEWTGHTVTVKADDHTRPIVLLNEESNRAFVFYANVYGGTVFVKTTPLDAITFEPGVGEPVIRGADVAVDDVTSTKQHVTSTSGIVVLAADQYSNVYLHNYLPLEGPPSTPSSPDAPTALSATAVSSARIDLAWTDASSNEEAFHIERSSDGGGFAQIAVAGPNVTRYSDTSVTAGTGYSYRVRAWNAQGFSTYSNAASATTPAAPLEAPTRLSARSTSTVATLSWTNNAPAAAGVAIERSSDGATFTLVGTVSASTSTYADSGLTPQSTYSYRVRAFTSDGNQSDYSNTATIKMKR